jgi:parvulin-like peptidyl-prolyl isomerase
VSKTVVTDQELQDYYKEHEVEFRQPGSFHIRELVLSQGTNAKEQKNTMTKLTAIQDQLNQGISFETLIKQYSIALSHSNGGDLGWLSGKALYATLEKSLLTLKNGQITDPIFIDNKIYLIQLLETKDDYLRPFAEIRNKLMEQLKDAKAQGAIEAYMQSLRMYANIRYLVPKDSILNG